MYVMKSLFYLIVVNDQYNLIVEMSIRNCIKINLYDKFTPFYNHNHSDIYYVYCNYIYVFIGLPLHMQNKITYFTAEHLILFLFLTAKIMFLLLTFIGCCPAKPPHIAWLQYFNPSTYNNTCHTYVCVQVYTTNKLRYIFFTIFHRLAPPILC